MSVTRPDVIKLGSSLFTLFIESSTSSLIWSIPMTFPRGPTCNVYNSAWRTHQKNDRSQMTHVEPPLNSPYVQSRQTESHCPSPRPELWLLRAAGHGEAPVHRHAERRREKAKRIQSNVLKSINIQNEFKTNLRSFFFYSQLIYIWMYFCFLYRQAMFFFSVFYDIKIIN